MGLLLLVLTAAAPDRRRRRSCRFSWSVLVLACTCWPPSATSSCSRVGSTPPRRSRLLIGDTDSLVAETECHMVLALQRMGCILTHVVFLDRHLTGSTLENIRSILRPLHFNTNLYMCESYEHANTFIKQSREKVLVLGIHAVWNTDEAAYQAFCESCTLHAANPKKVNFVSCDADVAWSWYLRHAGWKYLDTTLVTRPNPDTLVYHEPWVPLGQKDIIGAINCVLVC